MKNFVLALVLVLMSSLIAIGQKAPPAYAPVYNQTGTVTAWLASHDYNSSVTINGETSYVGCNVSDTTIDCDDSVGGFTVHLADGNTYVLGQPFVFSLGKYGGDEWMNATADHLASRVIANAFKPITFSYRLMTIKGKNNLAAGDYYCIASPTPVKHGVYEEFCYLIATGGSPVGRL